MTDFGKVIFDKLKDMFYDDFGDDWKGTFDKGELMPVVNMLLNSWCESQFFFVAGCTLKELYNWLNDDYIADRIDEETYNYRLAEVTSTYFFMGYDKKGL